MNKQELMAKVQALFHGEEEQTDWESGENGNALSEYYCRTAKRLQISYSLWKNEKKYWGDFLIALREYLLVFDTDIALKDVVIPDDNEYAIKKDSVTGKYYASFQFPEGVIFEFAEQAFMRNLDGEPLDNKPYNLMTDSYIYKLTGFKRFKSIAQKLAVYGALNMPDQYTALISLPTGGGKSLITQTLAYQKEGLTIVVVPTVSLAMDQVLAAKKIIQAQNMEDEIFSYCSEDNPEPILKAIRKKTARLLFISPESLLNNLKFEEGLQEANRQRYLKNVIIDEAHIVVDWGAAFRVDYQCLEAWRRNLILTNPSVRTILLSATFEKQAIAILKKLFSENEKWIEVRCDALRQEPRFIQIEEKSYSKKQETALALIKKLPHPMIIYVAHPAEAEQMKALLNRNGIYNVKTFTGRTNGKQRKERIKGWREDAFEIMVATSAFGVGVDKKDVRTVLHLYVPQNANGYYQELGRGGRDHLPCLSVMCTGPADFEDSRKRMVKRVMTTEKIVKRWNSMYNNKKSYRDGEICYIDTSIKPNYSTADEWEDAPASDTDRNWNIYVLLLLRRYSLIDILSVKKVKGVYIIAIKIKEDSLQNQDGDQFACIDQIHNQEWDFYNNSYQIMKQAIMGNQKDCLSEVFYETYDKVSVYCAGCRAHKDQKRSDWQEFPLKKPILEPVRKITSDQNAMFSSADEVVIFADGESKLRLIQVLEKKRLSVLVAEEHVLTEELPYFDRMDPVRSTYIIGQSELRELMKKQNGYYISGMIAVLYPKMEKEIWKTYKTVKRYLCGKSNIKIIHILEEDPYFESVGKKFSELAEGRVIPPEQLYA